ncbi:MAG: hypothetical protein RRY53_04130 [Pseudoflavonifractor sp.]
MGFIVTFPMSVCTSDVPNALIRHRTKDTHNHRFAFINFFIQYLPYPFVSDVAALTYGPAPDHNNQYLEKKINKTDAKAPQKTLLHPSLLNSDVILLPVYYNIRRCQQKTGRSIKNGFAVETNAGDAFGFGKQGRGKPGRRTSLPTGAAIRAL